MGCGCKKSKKRKLRQENVGREKLNKILSEQLKRSREIMGINEVAATKLPVINVSNGRLNIGGKIYKLQTEKMWVRINIDIIDVSVNKAGEATLVAKMPVTGEHVTSKIRKSNFDKVIAGAKQNKKEISVWNSPEPPDKPKEFFLVNVRS